MNSATLEIQDLQVHYLTAGQGEPVLLVHGWPTSSYLWRDIIPILAKTHYVIALDLPGFGQSDKPTDIAYTYDFYASIFSGLLKYLNITSYNLVVHDLGGPLGLYWALASPNKVLRLALLNTLIYPDISWATRLFLWSTYLPYFKTRLASRGGIKAAMRLGVENQAQLTRDTIKVYQEAFQNEDDLRALLKSVQGVNTQGLKVIADRLSTFQNPVSLIYGEDDRILTDIAQTMNRLKRDIPHAQVNPIPNCGHFLQEDDPQRVGELLSTFLNTPT
ncbi:MAG: alpha/beta fold hydrolase [Phototrophicaceae bacterium]